MYHVGLEVRILGVGSRMYEIRFLLATGSDVGYAGFEPNLRVMSLLLNMLLGLTLLGLKHYYPSPSGIVVEHWRLAPTRQHPIFSWRSFEVHLSTQRSTLNVQHQH